MRPTSPNDDAVDTKSSPSRDLTAVLKKYSEAFTPDELGEDVHTLYFSPSMGRGTRSTVAIPTLGIQHHVPGEPVRLAQKASLTVDKVAGRRVHTRAAFRLAGQDQWTYINTPRVKPRFTVHIGLVATEDQGWKIDALYTPGWEFGSDLTGLEADSLEDVFTAANRAFYEDEVMLCDLPLRPAVSAYVPIVDGDNKPRRCFRVRESDLIEEEGVGERSSLYQALDSLTEGKRSALIKRWCPEAIHEWSATVGVEQRRINLAELARETSHAIYVGWLDYSEDPTCWCYPFVDEMCSLLGSPVLKEDDDIEED